MFLTGYYWITASLVLSLNTASEYVNTKRSLKRDGDVRTDVLCSNGFFALGDRCMKIIVQADKTASWNDSLKKCIKITAGNGTLASLHSYMEHATVLAEMVRQFIPLWLGIKMMPGQQWQWMDNSTVDFTNWAENINHRGSSQEQYGLIMPSAAGYWMVGHSYETAGCLCQSPPLSKIRVTDSPVNVLNDWQEADCPYGWSHHDRACYRLHDGADSWQLANSSCVQDGAQMVSVHNPAENAFLLLLLDGATGWLGLNLDLQTVGMEREWSDGETAWFTVWSVGQPDPLTGRCTSIDRDGRWRTISCDYSLHYVCKMITKSSVRLPPQPKGVCPGGSWQAWSTYCYYIPGPQDALQTYHGAGQQCTTWSSPHFNVTLVSVNSPEENQIILSLLQERDSVNAYLGMTTHSTWDDGSAMAFSNWAAGEPNNERGLEMCAEMRTQDLPGKWNDIPCNQVKSFICKTKRAPESPSLTSGNQQKRACPGSGWHLIDRICLLVTPGDWLSRREADALCRRVGGKLAAILNARENGAIKRLLDKDNGDKSNAWMGLILDIKDDKWRWPDDTGSHFRNWERLPSENNGRRCTVFNVQTGRWLQQSCDAVQKRALCTTQSGFLQSPEGAIDSAVYEESKLSLSKNCIQTVDHIDAAAPPGWLHDVTIVGITLLAAILVVLSLILLVLVIRRRRSQFMPIPQHNGQS